MSALFAEHIAVLTKRAQKILQELSFAGIAIYAGSVKRQFLDDMDYPFKVNPHFKAWVPILDTPHCWLLVDGESKPKLVYHQPQDFWHKVNPLPDASWTDSLQLSVYAEQQDIANHLPINKDQWVFIGEEVELAKSLGFELFNHQRVLDYLHYHRAYKTEYELDCLRQANALAVKGHQAARAAFLGGGSEYQIHQAYLLSMQVTENELPYPNIIALNENAAILHYMVQDKRFQSESRSFLIDAGAQVNGYAADISRTYTNQQGLFADILAQMHHLQKKLVSKMKPGLSYIELHQQAHLAIAELLHRTGIIKASVNDILDQGLTKPFFPHGLGHMLGLQVHDAGGFLQDEKGGHLAAPKEYPFLRCTRQIEANQVFTIEPGFYVIDSLLQALPANSQRLLNTRLLDELRPFGGIRIEDNIIVHQDRIENITRDLGLND